MWVNDYIGLPWVSGGREFPNFDCWGLVRDVYMKQLNTELDVYPYNVADLDPVTKTMVRAMVRDLKQDWVELDEPEDLCLVTMSTHKVPHHVGIFLALDGGLVLHSGEHQSACCQTIRQLRHTQGFSSIRYFNHGTLHSS